MAHAWPLTFRFLSEYTPGKIKVARSTGLASDGSPRTLLRDMREHAAATKALLP